MRIKLVLLAAVSATGAFVSGQAQAANLYIYGGGSSLVAPYWRAAGDCYSVKTPLIFAGNPPTTLNVPSFDYTGSPSQDCATQPYTAGRVIDYISASSGTGISALFGHDATKFGDTDPTTDGAQFFPTINYANSETPLGAADVDVYNNGGTTGTVGVTVAAPGQPAPSGGYVNPKEHYGALIQFPDLVTPIDIIYDPVYKKVRQSDGSVKSYRFNVSSANARADGSGGLHLSTTILCAIFNGQIINWNDSRITTANGGASLQDPSDTGTFSAPLQIVGREDGSGTTTLLSRYLANVCASKTGNSYADGASRVPGTYVDSTGKTRTTTVASGGTNLAGVLYDKSQPNDSPSGETRGKFTLATGSDGVAKYVAFTKDPATKTGSSVAQARIAYIGPDYALPYVLNTQTNTYNLNTATLQNSSGHYVDPTPDSALLSFSVETPPQSHADGTYDPSQTDRSRANPQDWVEPSSKTSQLANPVRSRGYPIVGTSNLLTYQCFASNNTRSVLTSYLKYFTTSRTINDPSLGILTSSGFAPLPNAFRTAIGETFLSDTSGLGLVIGSSGTTAACTSSNSNG